MPDRLYFSTLTQGRKKGGWQTGSPSRLAPLKEGDLSCGLRPCQDLQMTRDSFHTALHNFARANSGFQHFAFA